MIERIEEMPAGTIGLRAGGNPSKADYREVLEPALREGVESGELRLLFVLTDFDGVEWVAKAMHLFSWMTPGEVEVRGLDELDAAKAWVAG